MAVRINKGGWILIFLIGVGLVGYALNKYGVFNFPSLTGANKVASSEAVDTSKPLLVPASATEQSSLVRVRVNIWVGCAPGLVANGGLDTVPGSIFDKNGVKVSFKI